MIILIVRQLHTKDIIEKLITLSLSLRINICFSKK